MKWGASAIVVSHDPIATRASFVALLVSILSLVVPELRWLPWWSAGVSVVAIVIAAAAALRNARGQEREPAVVEANARGLRVAGEEVLAREAMAYGFVEPAKAGAIVKIHDRAHAVRLEVRVTDAAEGTSLLQALGLDVAHRAAPFFAGSPAGGPRGTAISLGVASAAVPLLLGVLAAFGRSKSIAIDDLILMLRLAIPAFVVATWAILASVPLRVDVGADGVQVTWLGRRRFVPYRDIARVVPAFGQLRVVLVSGESLRIRGQRRSFTAKTAGAHHAMVDRMRAAIEEHLARSRAEDALSKLPPESPRLGDWVQALDALEVAAETSYRRAVVSAEGLWRVVEDVSAGPSSRVGAAIALRKVLDAHGRERMRVAAEASASPKLRVALEAASDGEVGAITASLEELLAQEA